MRFLKTLRSVTLSESRPLPEPASSSVKPPPHGSGQAPGSLSQKTAEFHSMSAKETCAPVVVTISVLLVETVLSAQLAWLWGRAISVLSDAASKCGRGMGAVWPTWKGTRRTRDPVPCAGGNQPPTTLTSLLRLIAAKVCNQTVILFSKVTPVFPKESQIKTNLLAK